MKNKTLLLLSILALLAILISACASAVPSTQAAESPSVQTAVTVAATDVPQNQPAAPVDQNGQPGQPAQDGNQSSETQPLNSQPSNEQSAQGGQPDQNGDCRPDLTVAATTLGITTEELQAALGETTQDKPDFTTAAGKLGITVEALQQAMQQARPSTCSNTGGGKGHGGLPPEAIDACVGLSQGAACSVNTPNGTLTGTCNTPPDASTQLACMPTGGPQQP